MSILFSCFPVPPGTRQSMVQKLYSEEGHDRTYFSKSSSNQFLKLKHVTGKLQDISTRDTILTQTHPISRTKKNEQHRIVCHIIISLFWFLFSKHYHLIFRVWSQLFHSQANLAIFFINHSEFVLAKTKIAYLRELTQKIAFQSDSFGLNTFIIKSNTLGWNFKQCFCALRQYKKKCLSCCNLKDHSKMLNGKHTED